MIFVETEIAGAYLVEPERIADERGFFARTWCLDEFAAHGLETALVQCNTSFNGQRGTLRGMHYQREPYSEVKLVRCTRGAIHDVIIDMRPESPSFHRSTGVELSADNGIALYIPKGCAHGYITLFDDTEVFYQMSTLYRPEAAAGVRWDDPTFGITWPLPVRMIGQRDAAYPLLGAD